MRNILALTAEQQITGGITVTSGELKLTGAGSFSNLAHLETSADATISATGART
jgi:hypothetical protein